MIPIRQAELMLARQQPERARVLFEEALALDPDQRSARIGLARLHLQQRRPEQVIELLASHQQDAALGDEGSYLLAQAYRQVGDLERARAQLDRLSGEAGEPGDVVIDDPWMDELAAINLSSNFLTRLGARAYDRGAFDIAAHHAGRAAALNPDNAELIANHAAALLGLDRPRAALARVEAALAIDPELARAHLILGSIQRRLGASIAAERAWRRALELDPQHREARLSLARSYKDRGELEAAIVEYAKLREDGGEVTHLRFWHAALLAALRRNDEALTAIASDLARQPDAIELELLQLRLLAVTARDEHELARVRDQVQRLDDVPASVLRLETQAMLAATAGDFEHAIERQLHALNELEQLPNTALAHHARRRLTLYREHKSVLRAWDADEPLMLHPATRIAQGQPTR